MQTVNKDKALLTWARQNPFLSDLLIMGYLKEDDGSCAVIPMPEAEDIQSYIGGITIKQYDFLLQLMFQASILDDEINTNQYHMLRKWQKWVEDQEMDGNYPDFGEKCSNYELLNLSSDPQIAKTYENGMIQLQFPVRLIYEEDK